MYKSKFYAVIDFIEQIIKDIIKNKNSIPVPIKKLCKIISELIIQKFPNINMVDRNSFISKFFFNKLLIPFLSTNYLFSHISKNTISNLKFICSILQKYISGNLFCSDDSEYSFTPFNWYIIYNIKYSFPLFESLTKVNLSSHQENLINNKLPLDYEYEYFKENPDKDAYISSIIININQIKALIVTIDSNKKKLLFTDNNINSIKRATEKLMVGHNKELIENIQSRERRI